MARTPADAQSGALSLQQTGWIWDALRAPGSNFAGLLLPLAASAARFEADAEALLEEVDPLTCDALLPDWERLLQLPDPCAGLDPDIGPRKAQARARLTDRGGTSVAALVAYALALGFTLEITEFRQARIGISRIGDPIADVTWRYAFMLAGVVDLLAPDGALTPTRKSVLLCEMDRLRPVETTVLWGDPPTTTLDVSADVEPMVAG